MKARGRILAMMAAIAVIATLLALIFSTPTAPIIPPLPDPNGYLDLLEAGKVARSNPRSVSEMSASELQSFVTAESNALELVKRGLAKECAVPVDFSEGWMRTRLPGLSGIKTLSSILNAEARLIATTNSISGARAYIESLRFAVAVGRGGLIIDHLIGLSCQHFPVKKLKELRDQLDAAEAREIFDALEKIYRNRQPAKEFVARDNQWSRVAGDWRSRVALMIRPGLVGAANQKYLERARAGEDEMKALLIDFATRLQEIEKDKEHGDIKRIISELRTKD